MSSKTRPQHIEAIDKLPISTREYMLGVIVEIYPQDIYREMHGLRKRSDQDSVQITAVGGTGRRTGLTPGSRSRTYLASWARRNLFKIDETEEDR